MSLIANNIGLRFANGPGVDFGASVSGVGENRNEYGNDDHDK